MFKRSTNKTEGPKDKTLKDSCCSQGLQDSSKVTLGEHPLPIFRKGTQCAAAPTVTDPQDLSPGRALHRPGPPCGDGLVLSSVPHHVLKCQPHQSLATRKPVICPVQTAAQGGKIKDALTCHSVYYKNHFLFCPQ